MAEELVPIARMLWDAKYRADGDQRVQREIESFRFLPAGRILAGAGSGRRVTLLNCFVTGTIVDSLDSIFDALKEGTVTLQQGGGAARPPGRAHCSEGG